MIKSKLRQDKHLFVTLEDRVDYIFSRTGARARRVLGARVTTTGPLRIRTVDEALELLEMSFADIHKRDTARMAFRRLRYSEGSDFHNFCTEFTQLALESELAEQEYKQEFVYRMPHRIAYPPHLPGEERGGLVQAVRRTSVRIRPLSGLRQTETIRCTAPVLPTPRSDPLRGSRRLSRPPLALRHGRQRVGPRPQSLCYAYSYNSPNTEYPIDYGSCLPSPGYGYPTICLIHRRPQPSRSFATTAGRRGHYSKECSAPRASRITEIVDETAEEEPYEEEDRGDDLHDPVGEESYEELYEDEQEKAQA